MVNKKKRQVKIQGASSDIKDLVEGKDKSVKDNNKREATRALKWPYQEAVATSRYINKLAKKLLK